MLKIAGVVANMPTLWSKDISIQVTADGKMQKWVYETEHVTNPKVKVGDKVKAGQIIAEVGSFNKGDPKGFGVECLKRLQSSAGRWYHEVGFSAALVNFLKKIADFQSAEVYKSWEDYIGDTSLYDESLKVPGCLTLDPIQWLYFLPPSNLSI